MSVRHNPSGRVLVGEVVPPGLEVLNLSDIPLASGKVLEIGSNNAKPYSQPKPNPPQQPLISSSSPPLPMTASSKSLPPLPTHPLLPSQHSHTPGHSIDLSYRLQQLTDMLPKQFSQAFEAVSTYRQQDKAMYEQFNELKQMVEQCVKNDGKEETSQREQEEEDGK